MLAVIQTGGKQYDIQVGDTIEIEKIDGKAGDQVFFDQVLLLDDEKDIKIGKPFLKDQKIEAKILEQKKAPKITIVKQKAKKRYSKKQGHQQRLTVVEIIKI
jgi:large subunit ribosomal protein L21